MPRRLVTATIMLLVPLVTGCAEGRDVVTRTQDCAGLAQDVAASGLSGVPTRAEAEQAVDRLDRRLEELDNDAVREAATGLRDRLRELQQAVASADAAAAQEAAAQARDAARTVASTCGIPLDQVLGQ